MTVEERNHAIGIVEEYKRISSDIEIVICSLDKLTNQKDELMKRLHDLKERESNFMKEYKNKYGNRDLLADLNLEAS